MNNSSAPLLSPLRHRWVRRRCQPPSASALLRRMWMLVLGPNSTSDTASQQSTKSRATRQCQVSTRPMRFSSINDSEKNMQRLLQPAQQTSTLNLRFLPLSRGGSQQSLYSIEIFVCDLPHNIRLNANLIKQRQYNVQRIHHCFITIPALCLRTILRRWYLSIPI